MKKIIIAASAIAMAIVSQAANYKWMCADDGIYAAGSDSYYNGTAYLFDSAVSQQTVLDAFLVDGTVSGYISGANGTMTDAFGMDDATEEGFAFNGYAAEVDWNAYLVVKDGDKIFFSDLTDAITTPAGQDATMIFINDPSAASKLPVNTSGTYSASGWYTAVPEPTSGLLLLLGVAGLALRRRRA